MSMRLVVALLQRTSIHLAGDGAREFVHHQNMFGVMKLRHATIQVIVHHMGVFLRTRCRTNAALSRVDTKLFLVAGDGFGRIVGLDERHRAIPPGFIGGAEHIGILHAGNAQQNILNFGRVDVSPPEIMRSSVRAYTRKRPLRSIDALSPVTK